MILPEALDQLADLDDLLRVQADGRLIEDQRLRISEQGLCKTDPLAVSFRQVADQSSLHTVDCQLLHDFIDLFFSLRLRNFFQLRDEFQIFQNSHIRVERRNFGQIPYRLLCLFRFLKNIVSIDDDIAFRGCDVAGHDIHGR